MFGGAETLLVTLAKNRDASPDVESEFAVSFPGRLEDELTATGAAVHRIGGALRKTDVPRMAAANARLFRLLGKRRVDAVVMHGTWEHAQFGVSARVRGVPIVHWAHRAPVGVGWADRLSRVLAADLVLASSHFIKSELGALFPASPITVVRPPVGAPHHPSGVRDRVRAEIGVSASATVIACVARFEPWKGHQLLLSAAARLVDVPDWEVWLIGGAQRPEEARYEGEVREQCTRSGLADRVRFLGQRADVPRLLAAADVYCQPNVGPEPFGIGFVQALYAGLPVVATAMGGALEIVDSTCGVLTTSDEIAVSEALRALLVDPEQRARLSRGGFDRALALCEPAARIRELDAALAGIRRTGL